jgi:hypothetical protein
MMTLAPTQKRTALMLPFFSRAELQLTAWRDTQAKSNFGLSA